MKRFFMLFIAALVVFTTVQAQDTTNLTGKLIQGTAGGAPLAPDIPVRLEIFSSEGELRETYSAISDAEGNVVFESVPRYTDGSLYVLVATWAGIEQSSLPVTLTENSQSLELPLYETTTSLNDVVLYEGNLQVNFEQTNAVGVQMLLEITYTNLGDKIVLANPVTGAFTAELPVGALAIAPEQVEGSALRFQPVDQIGDLAIPGIRDMQPLVPNWPNIMRVSFFVPYELGAIIDMRFPFSVNNIRIFVRQDTVYVDGGELFEFTDETETSSGRVYQIYEQTRPLKSGEPFKFSLVGQPTQTVQKSSERSSDDGSSSAMTIVLVVVFVALVIFVGLTVWLVQARKKTL
jgi:hypothetical protein